MATNREIARHLFLSTTSVQDYISKGVLRKEMTLDEAREAYIMALRKRAAGDRRGAPAPEIGEAKVSVDREKALNLQVDTRLKTLREQQLRRELAPVEVITWVLSKVAGQVGAILDSVPLKVKRLLPRLTTSEVEVIKREIVKAQNAAAKVTVDLNEYFVGRDKTLTDESD